MSWDEVSLLVPRNLIFLLMVSWWDSLAYCNMYVGLAALTLRLFPRTKLYETGVDDIKYDHDLFAPAPRDTSKGVRAIIL